MKNAMKKVLLWCLVLLMAITFQPISANAATKSVKLKAPVVSNWKKTQDSRIDGDKIGDGLEYTIKWKKVVGASGYQIKVTVRDEGKWGSKYITTKRCYYREAGTTTDASKAKVRAYKIVNGKKKYGPWSKIKSCVWK